MKSTLSFQLTQIVSVLSIFFLLIPRISEAQELTKKQMEVMYAEAYELDRHRYDDAKIIQGAKIAYRLAQAAPANIKYQLLAMESLNHYMDVVRPAAKNNEDSKKLFYRLHQQILEIGDRILKKNPKNAPAIILRSLAETTKGDFDGIRASIVVIKPTFRALRKARKIDPKALNGLGLLIMGRMYYVVPGLLGGDTEESIKYLEEAREINPNDFSLHQFLAESYEDEGEDKKAKASLETLLTISAKTFQLQEAVNILYQASGLAKRWDYKELAKKLNARKEELLKQHPYLSDPTQ